MNNNQTNPKQQLDRVNQNAKNKLAATARKRERQRGGGEREGGRDRDRETETERYTERERERQRDTEREKNAHKWFSMNAIFNYYFFKQKCNGKQHHNGCVVLCW